MSPPLFRPPSEGLDQKAVEALRQQLQRITRVLESANGNVRTRLGDAKGITEWTVTNTDGTDVLAVDSAGNLVVSTIAAPDAVWELGEYVETAYAYAAKTANYTLLATDGTIEYTSGSYTATLPSAVGLTSKVYNIKNSGNGVITINTTSSQTIDGNASGVLKLVQYDNLTVQSTGSAWIVL